MDPNDGRANHFFASKPAEFRTPTTDMEPERRERVLAFSLRPYAPKYYPMLINRQAADATFLGFHDEYMEMVLEYADGQMGDEGAREECKPFWTETEFGPADNWRLIEKVELKPHECGQSVFLTFETRTGSDVLLLSALGTQRLQKAVEGFLLRR